jgi:hypothetical protein
LAGYAYRGRRVKTDASVRFLPLTEPTPEPEPEPEPEPDYGDMLKADLVAMAEDRGLDTDGTKADLIERLSDG